MEKHRESSPSPAHQAVEGVVSASMTGMDGKGPFVLGPVRLMTDGDLIGSAGSECNAVHLLNSDILEEVRWAILILYGVA
jgi:hypothetical protein